MTLNRKASIYEVKYDDNGELKSVLRYLHVAIEDRKGYSYIPEWAVVMAGLFSLAVFIILTAGLTIFYTAPPNALYGEDCSSRSCVKGFNLKCINKTCSCTSSQYYSRGCKDKKTYNQICFSNNASCEDNKNFECLDGVCKCNDDISYWNGKQCVFKGAYKEICQYAEQCMPNLMLICSTSLKICYCDDSRCNLL